MTNYTIKAYNRVKGVTERTSVDVEDMDDAAHRASDLYRAQPDFAAWTVIIMGPIGSKRADTMDCWYPALWQLKQDLKKKRAEKSRKM